MSPGMTGIIKIMLAPSYTNDYSLYLHKNLKRQTKLAT
jgi:hypothetical protein